MGTGLLFSWNYSFDMQPLVFTLFITTGDLPFFDFVSFESYKQTTWLLFIIIHLIKSTVRVNIATPNQIMIAIPQPQLEPDWIEKQTSRGVIQNLSINQIKCSFLAVISEIVQICVLDYFTIGTGVWTGLVFGINGVIGLSVATKTSKCNLIALFIMSTISIVFSYILICFGFLIEFACETQIERRFDLKFQLKCNFYFPV